VSNPFTPGAGYFPPHLAGREDTIARFRKHLLRSKEIPHHFVLTGLRGTGKTVLLSEFQRVCRDDGWLCVRRELSEAEAETELMGKAVLADLLRAATAASAGTKAIETARRLALALKPRQVGAFGLSYSPAYGTEPPPPLRDQLVHALWEMAPVITRRHQGLVLLYDEFHEVWDGRRRHATPLGTFFGAVKEAQLQGFPVVVVACGLPPVAVNIVRSRSYLERDLTVETLGNLSDKDARAAITWPLASVGVAFTERLADAIVTDTRGYPYFLQYYGWFLLDTLPEAEELDLDLFHKLRPILLEGLDRGFFAGHYAKLPRAERAALRAIALVGDRARVAAIPWRGNYAVLRASVSRLVERGQLYRPSERGEVAFSLPLYRDYLRRVGEDQ